MVSLSIDTRMINSSGIGRYIQNLIPLLINSGRLQLTCLGNFEVLSKYYWFNEVNFIELRSEIFSISEQIELLKMIPVCDIFWSPQYNVPIFPIRAKKRVVTIHDVYQLAHLSELTLLKKIYVKVMTFFAVKLSASIVTVSEFSRHEILRLSSADRTKITVIYNAVDEKFSTNVESRQFDEKYILFVGNVKPHKNLHNALKAFRLFLQKNDNYKFYIVGKKEGFITGVNNLNTLIKGMENSVIFTGYISDRELKAYYANASLFFFPSYYEGFGLPILEAMKFSIPILSSNASSLPEVGGDAIFYCDPNNIEDMAEKLESILDIKIPFLKMKYKNQLEKFSWNASLEKHIALFYGLFEKDDI